MKMSPEFAKAQKNMEPGVITSDGFLGDDTRPIVDIIEADEERFAQLGMEFDTVAAKLRELLDKGRAGLGEPVTVEDRWIVTSSEARGHLASPFEDGIFRKVNARVERLENGKPSGDVLIYSDLSLHLMETNHFLQGKGASFRLDPEKIKKVIGV